MHFFSLIKIFFFSPLNWLLLSDMFRLCFVCYLFFFLPLWKEGDKNHYFPAACLILDSERFFSTICLQQRKQNFPQYWCSGEARLHKEKHYSSFHTQSFFSLTGGSRMVPTCSWAFWLLFYFTETEIRHSNTTCK